MRPEEPTYGSDKNGLVWGYLFQADQPPKEMDSDAAAASAAGSPTPHVVRPVQSAGIMESMEVWPVPLVESPIPAPLLSKRQEILALAARHRARSLKIFGSFARGEAHAASDVDFLVELGPGATLLDLGSLQMDLQDLLGRKVDVVEPDALHWSIRERVLREAVPL